jgi:hypothetical protein
LEVPQNVISTASDVPPVRDALSLEGVNVFHQDTVGIGPEYDVVITDNDAIISKVESLADGGVVGFAE